MNKKIVIISICVIICLAGLIYAYTIVKENKTANNEILKSEHATYENIQENKEQTQPINSDKENDVIATQKGPDKPQKIGTYIPIYCSINNRGSNTIYDVNAGSQAFKNMNKNFGTLKPGETKKFTYMLYLPKTSDHIDILDNKPLPNPFYIGGFLIDFKDGKGVVHVTTSNSIKIKWYN
jgi:hypothetical protein